MYKRLLVLMLAGTSLLTGCGGSGSSASSSQETQKTWVRAHLNDVYLWYDQIVEVPSANYASAPDYFDALLVRTQDHFSFSMPLAEATSLLQDGMDMGYGVKWGLATSNRLFAYYVDPNSPAASFITRGTEVTAVNGQSAATLAVSNIDYLNAALFPAQAGSAVSLTLRAPGTSSTQTRSFSSATYSSTTVSLPSILTLANGGKAGYLLFNEHLLTSEQAEQGLIQALSSFKQQGISELVLDLRYNNGGYLMIAEEVASMIGGAPVQGKTFERLLFNSRHPEKTQNPGNTLSYTAQSSQGATLPQLGLTRVFVLTGGSTCSASEAIINGLLPYVQVVLIGGTTCGKPYGMIQTNNDNQAYFAIQFEGVNASGSDNFKNGFAPTCSVGDDLNYPLSDIREARLSAALYYANNNSCPPASTLTLPKAALSSEIPASGEVKIIGQRPGLKLLR
jgi:carboxyl-terminal processing protease